MILSFAGSVLFFCFVLTYLRVMILIMADCFCENTDSVGFAAWLKRVPCGTGDALV